MGERDDGQWYFGQKNRDVTDGTKRTMGFTRLKTMFETKT
jgi:hypothetical protein